MEFMLEATWQVFVVGLLLFEWIVRLVMLFIVPRKRHPSSATAWLLLIMIAPTLGTILFLLIGSPKLNSIRRQQQLRIESLTAQLLLVLRRKNPDVFVQPTAETHTQVAALAQTIGGFPSVQGNQVEVETNYQAIMQRQAALIDEATSYVHLEYFILAMDVETECIFESIERARKRGVTVRVLYDFVSRYYPHYKAMRKRLTVAGVEHHIMLPLTLLPSKHFSRPDLRNHRKILVVDGVSGCLGSANLITDSYHRKDDLRYEEMACLLRGPIIWQLNAVFRSDWYAETYNDLNELYETETHPEIQGTVLAQALPSGPGHIHENNLLVYAQLFHAATSKISIVVPYFVPDEVVVAALVSAKKRGVEVTIINSEIKDKLLVAHAQRSFYEELLEIGIKIYHYKKPIFLHNKQVAVDDTVAIIGSSNLDIRSFELNQELSMIIYDKSVLVRLADIEKRYKKGSKEITLQAWRKRSKPAKFIDGVARITAALQ